MTNIQSKFVFITYERTKPQSGRDTHFHSPCSLTSSEVSWDQRGVYLTKSRGTPSYAWHWYHGYLLTHFTQQTQGLMEVWSGMMMGNGEGIFKEQKSLWSLFVLLYLSSINSLANQYLYWWFFCCQKPYFVNPIVYLFYHKSFDCKLLYKTQISAISR